jgi:hypothetical protein
MQVLRQDYAYQMQRTEAAYDGASSQAAAAAAAAAQQSDVAGSSSSAVAVQSSIEQQQQQAVAEGFVSIETHEAVLSRCASTRHFLHFTVRACSFHCSLRVYWHRSIAACLIQLAAHSKCTAVRRYNGKARVSSLIAAASCYFVHVNV